MAQPPYVYSAPENAEEANSRIKHWMGDLSKFQAKLGLQPMGYYPKYSGTRTENSRVETMIAVDQKLHPEKWAEPIAPLPSLRDNWLGTLIQTRDHAKTFIATWTDIDHVKDVLAVLVKDLAEKIKAQVLDWLGRTPPGIPIIPVIPPFKGKRSSPFDPKTWREVQEAIATEKIRDPGTDEGLHL